VSRIQSRNIELRFGIESKSIDILPVELNLPNSTQQLKVKSPRLRLGFVGRIHQDRGTGLFIEIIKILGKLHEGIEAVVVGDGPARDDFLGTLSAFGPNVNVNYLGFLEGESLAKAWTNIDILLSTAPLESYGRTIRECLISTTPVLAIESSGVLELEYALKRNWIQLISLPLEPTKLSHQVKTALGIEISSQYREALAKESQRSSLNLVLRWIEIIQESQRQLELDN
jgi:glycosyltransferase involved in cell wall biosynthesis